MDDLPDEVLEALRSPEELSRLQLEALAVSLVAKRDAAVSARKDSGIEDVWQKAEEAYLGIDESNRGSFQNARWSKPTTMEGPVTSNSAASRGEGEAKSTAYFRLTSRYVDAGYAKLCEILLPANARPFSFGATPVQELADKLKDDTQAIHNGEPLERPATPEEAAQLPEGEEKTVPVKVSDVAKEALDRANEKAKKAEKRIYDWMVESRTRGELRKTVFDAARIGTGVLKGPFPRRKTYKKRGDDGGIEFLSKVTPSYEWADVWTLFPDPACGERVSDGDHLFQYEPFTRKQLRKLKGDPGYIKEAIDRVLAEGPMSGPFEAKRPNQEVSKHRFTVWYYYGTLLREEMMAAGYEPARGDERTEYYAICTMVNDVVIRAVLNPLDSGEFPYHVMPWQRRVGYWAGVGIGEQIEMPQRAINAALRAMFNNAGKSAGGILVLDRGAITPADGNWTISPDKVFYKKADAGGDDVRKAFEYYQVPNVTNQMMSIIELQLRLAEESTNIPLVTQGQSGPTTPETFGATQLQNSNANQLLRSIGYAFDDHITEPMVLQSYEYLLLDPEVPEEEKGDWTVDAHGSVSLVERAIQEQTIRQMGEFALQPAFGVNPKKWFAEFSQTNKLDPKNFQYTKEEQAEIDKRGTPPPPAVQVAQLKMSDNKEERALKKMLAEMMAQVNQTTEQASNQSKEQIALMRKEVEELRIQRDTDRDTVYVQAETRRTDNEYQVRMQEMQLRERLALLEYANKKDLKLEDVKKQLADTSMRLNVQKELAAADRELDAQKHKAPAIKAPVEVPGKARPGKSFTE